jgi:hypothetical protein
MGEILDLTAFQAVKMVMPFSVGIESSFPAQARNPVHESDSFEGEKGSVDRVE